MRQGLKISAGYWLCDGLCGTGCCIFATLIAAVQHYASELKIGYLFSQSAETPCVASKKTEFRDLCHDLNLMYTLPYVCNSL